MPKDIQNRWKCTSQAVMASRQNVLPTASIKMTGHHYVDPGLQEHQGPCPCKVHTAMPVHQLDIQYHVSHTYVLAPLIGYTASLALP